MWKAKFRKKLFVKIHPCTICAYILLSSVIPNICFASQTAVPGKLKAKISIRAATPDEEFGIIWYTLRNMAFFREHGYDVAFPNHERFTQLSEVLEDISKADKKELYELFTRKKFF